MTFRMNFCAIFPTVINKILNVIIIASALKKLANNNCNNKGNDYCSCLCLFCTNYS